MYLEPLPTMGRVGQSLLTRGMVGHDDVPPDPCDALSTNSRGSFDLSSVSGSLVTA